MPFEVGRIEWNGDEIGVFVEAGAVRGLALAAEHLLGVSRQIVPHQEGILELSGGTDVDPEALEASVFYDTVYAARQHEEIDWKHAPGRQAKYLENPMNAERPVMLEIIRAEIRKELEAG